MPNSSRPKDKERQRAREEEGDQARCHESRNEHSPDSFHSGTTRVLKSTGEGGCFFPFFFFMLLNSCTHEYLDGVMKSVQMLTPSAKPAQSRGRPTIWHHRPQSPRLMALTSEATNRNTTLSWRTRLARRRRRLLRSNRSRRPLCGKTPLRNGGDSFGASLQDRIKSRGGRVCLVIIDCRRRPCTL